MSKLESKKEIKVSVKLKAISDGYYKGSVIKAGEIFQYEGGLNRSNGLPLWTEPAEKFDLKAAIEAAKPKSAAVKGEAPAALPSL